MRRTMAEEKTIGGVKYDEDIWLLLPCHMTRNFRIDSQLDTFFLKKKEIREVKSRT